MHPRIEAVMLVGETALELAVKAEGYDAIGLVRKAYEEYGDDATFMAERWCDQLIEALGLRKDSRMNLEIERDPGEPGPWRTHPDQPDEETPFRNWWSAEMVAARLREDGHRWAELMSMVQATWLPCMLCLLQTVALTMRNADEYRSKMEERALAKAAARKAVARWN